MKSPEELGISNWPWSHNGRCVIDANNIKIASTNVWNGGNCHPYAHNGQLMSVSPELYNALYTLVKIQEDGAKEDMLIPAAWEYAKIVLAKAAGEDAK